MSSVNICKTLAASDWIAISSGVIALCALGVSLWQGWLARQHSRLTSRPLLEIECNAYQNAGIIIKNCGFGPGIIKSISVTSNNQEFQLCGRKDYQKFVDHILPEKARALVETLIPEKYSAIGAGEKLFILHIKKAEDENKVSDYLNTLFKAFVLVIEYESLYKESFTITYGQQ